MSETDDYFIEDIVNTKERRKKVNSKDKGARGERSLVRLLSERFPDKKGFFRVVGSGNRWSQVTLTEQAAEVMTGDLVTPANFKLSIECKYGYADIDLCSAFDNGNKQIDEFLDQTERDANRVKKIPLLCWRKPRGLWLAWLKQTWLPETAQFTYKLHYRDWIVLSLTELLKLDDEFFFHSKPLI